jgi:hypothetical protein
VTIIPQWASEVIPWWAKGKCTAFSLQASMAFKWQN